MPLLRKKKKLLLNFQNLNPERIRRMMTDFVFVCGLNALCVNTDFAFLVPSNYNLIINLSRINIFRCQFFLINKNNMLQVPKLPSDFVLKRKSLQCQRSL